MSLPCPPLSPHGSAERRALPHALPLPPFPTPVRGRELHSTPFHLSPAQRRAPLYSLSLPSSLLPCALHSSAVPYCFLSNGQVLHAEGTSGASAACLPGCLPAGCWCCRLPAYWVLALPPACRFASIPIMPLSASWLLLSACMLLLPACLRLLLPGCMHESCCYCLPATCCSCLRLLPACHVLLVPLPACCPCLLVGAVC